MKTKIFTLLVVAASLQCRADPPLSENQVVIGQPSVFWHNAEWQTYKNGVWTPYGKQAAHTSSQSSSTEGEVHPDSRMRNFGPAPRDTSRKSARLSRGANAGIGSTTIGIGQPNGIGQTTIGIGKPNVGIGRNNTGIGQSNVAIGQPNGIGQTTIGVGQPNVGIGRNNTGIGQPNVGIGQPNGIGQTTIGIGKPMRFPNQQPSSSQDTAR